MLGLHLVEEAVAAIDAGAARLIMHDDGDVALIADQRGHLVGGSARGGDVVGRAGGQRNVAVDAGVEGDDRDLLGLRLLQERDGGLADRARRSRARCGCLASAAESMSICLSTMASVSGPSKVILTVASWPPAGRRASRPARTDAGSPWRSAGCRSSAAPRRRRRGSAALPPAPMPNLPIILFPPLTLSRHLRREPPVYRQRCADRATATRSPVPKPSRSSCAAECRRRRPG